jgi:hypothetical protein
LAKSSSPAPICIVSHQEHCHPSWHGTSAIGNYLPATVQIPKLNKLTMLEDTKFTSSIVHELALAMLKRQGSWGVSIVSSQQQFIFDI